MPKPKKRKAPNIGSIFEKIYKGKTYKLKVIYSPNGLAFELDGDIFKTPTAAAKSITKREVNGWEFWLMNK